MAVHGTAARGLQDSELNTRCLTSQKQASLYRALEGHGLEHAWRRLARRPIFNGTGDNSAVPLHMGRVVSYLTGLTSGCRSAVGKYRPV